jgi:mannose-1-phosphate guanylyltransferase
MSRSERPKQLIRFIERPGETGRHSLLELATHRLKGLIEDDKRYICTAEAYRSIIREQLESLTDEQIIGEPMGRDTVNAVGLTAAVLAKEDSDAIFAVLTADHLIEPEAVFRERMDLGFRLVEADPTRFVTFSIKPTFPATGFGYIERGAPIRAKGKSQDAGWQDAYHVARFVEKPDLARAQVYVESGDFAWNSGMFVWKATSFLEALERFKPESHEGIMKIQRAWGTKKSRQVLEEVYPTLPKISVDYAIMEPLAKLAIGDETDAAAAKRGGKRFSVCTVQMDVQWLDVGSWPNFAETIPADKSGNRTAGEGSTLLVGTRNNLVVNAQPSHTVAVLGAEDLIVIHTPDATLVMPRSKAEELKLLHARLEPDLT